MKIHKHIQDAGVALTIERIGAISCYTGPSGKGFIVRLLGNQDETTHSKEDAQAILVDIGKSLIALAGKM